ncbi:MAG: ABC transporter ATP-binding protein [Acidobacteria bacterium]|nr:ABC transporter ATP-binding protein [Acidobacteriota bacterium]
MILTVDHVCFEYRKGQPVLENVSFQLKRGDKMALVGPSGSGKSTLIQIIAGLQNWASGSIHLDGEPMQAHNDGQLSHVRNHKLGIIFQDYNLLPALTVEENIRLRLALAGQPFQRPRLMEMLERLEMQDYIKTKVRQLSGGQQQRVALVRAMISQPQLILADEPSGNLDDVSTRLLLDVLLADPDQTVLVATHDQRVLQRMAFRMEVGLWRAHAIHVA